MGSLHGRYPTVSDTKMWEMGKAEGWKSLFSPRGSQQQRTQLGALQRARKKAQHLPKLANEVTGEAQRDFGYYTLWWRNLILLPRSVLCWWIQFPAVYWCLDKEEIWTEKPDLPRFPMLLASLCLGMLHPKSLKKHVKEHFLCFSSS